MKRKTIAWIMVGLVLLSGCGARQDVPELIEPVVNNESFRPVEYGSVAKTEIEIADVVPEEYCHFIQKASKISEICVDLGQYVEKGEIIAKIDVSEFQRELDGKREELALQNTNYSYQEKIYKEQIQIQKYRKEDYTNQGDKKAANQCDTEIEVLKENQRYDKMLYEHKVTMLGEEIAELSELTEDGTIQAEYSGYVTYVKNLAESDRVGAYENIVIISDYNQLHLELMQDISSSFYVQYIGRIYNQIYTIIDGKHCDAEVYSHSNQELVAIQSAGSYPRIRLDVENLEKNATIGDKIPVYFTSADEEAVLRIGTDSLYNENDTYFVYVKNGEDKEKREIQIGYQGESYVEVTDGLEEGEWVYYSSNAIMPEKYEEYIVEKQEFAPTNGEFGLKGADTYTQVYSYTIEEDAVVESVYFSERDQVKKGDLICVLKTSGSSAQMKEIQQNMSNQSDDYESRLEAFDTQIKDLDKQIKAAKKKVSKEEQVSEEQETTTENATVEEKNEKETTEKEAVGEETTEIPSVKEALDDVSVEQEGVSSEAESVPGQTQIIAESEEQSTNAVTDTENNQSESVAPGTEELIEGNTEKTGETSTEKVSGEDTEKTSETSTAEAAGDNKAETGTEEAAKSAPDAPTADSKEKQSVSATEVQQLQCQKRILQYEKKKYMAQYNYNYQMMQRNYERLSKSNNGQGQMKIYAEQDGLLGNVNVYEEKEIEVAKNDILFQIYNEDSRKLFINTRTDYLGVGNEVTVQSISDTDVSVTATVVGNSAVGKAYIALQDDKIYVTKSSSNGDGNQAYLSVKDKDWEKGIIGGKVLYSLARLRDVVVVPGTMLYEEVNQWSPDVTRYYVWKIVDGILVKQYVQVEESFNTTGQACILDGLDAGDVLANPVINEE